MTGRRRTGLALALAGAGALAVSPFLAWAKGDAVVASFTETGIDAGWGWITVGTALLAALVAVVALRRSRPGPAWLALAALALVAGGVTAYEFTAVRDSLRDAHHQATIDVSEDFSVDALTTRYGEGLYVSAAAAGVVLVGALLARDGRD